MRPTSLLLVAAGALLGTALGGAGAQAQGYRQCAVEGGYCRVPYPAQVIFGARGQVLQRFVEGGIPCTRGAFGGDPAPGIVKNCLFVAGGRGGPRGYDPEYRGGYGGPPPRDPYGGPRRRYVPDDEY